MSATTSPNADREVAVSTFSISCPCQCGAVVEARDAGFDATTVEIDTCEAWRAVSGGYHAPMAIEIRKSLAYSQAVPTTVISHRDGLVGFATEAPLTNTPADYYSRPRAYYGD